MARFYIAIIAFIALEISLLNACEDMFATEGEIGSFTSHDDHPENYDNSYHECWHIFADDGYILKVWTPEFNLEFRYDFMHILCGPDGEDGAMGSFHGSAGISAQLPRYSDGPILNVHILTDYSIRSSGFVFNFTAVNATVHGHENDCLTWDEIEDQFSDDYDDFWDNHDHDDSPPPEDDHHGPSTALIIFLVFLFIIIIASIAACVICFYCSIKTRPARTVTMGTTGYPRAGQGMTPVGSTMAGAGAFALPAYENSTYNNPNAPREEEKSQPQNFVSAPEYPVSPPPTYTTPHV